MSLDKLRSLHQRLLLAGCNNRYIAIEGVISGNDDVFRLSLQDKVWNIGYWERGKQRHTEYESRDIDDAIKRYEHKIMSIQHTHFIAVTRDERKILRIQADLQKHEIQYTRNDIPNFNGPKDHMYRLYVIGKDIFEVERIFGKREFVREGIRP